MQRWEAKKKSNFQQFRMAMQNAKGAPAAGQRPRLRKMNFITCAKSCKPCELRKSEFRNLWEISQALQTKEIEFRNLCKISQALRNKALKNQAKAIFAYHAKFRKACEIVLCNS